MKLWGWLVSAVLFLPGSQEPEERPVLLATVLYNPQPPREGEGRGLNESFDGGKTWRAPAWRDQHTTSVSVDGSGRWVYLAAGNGVLVSQDGGQNWRLSGGWEMTEVQRVCIDRRNPKRAWAATAYGVHLTRDVTVPGNPWSAASHEGLFRHCSDIVQDLQAPDLLWVGSERGIFVSASAGRSYRPVGPAVPCRRILQDRSDPKRFWAATDGMGILTSVDSGRHWERLPGLPEVCFSIEQDPSDPKHLLCGTIDGVWGSVDGGVRWERRSEGLGENRVVYDLCFDSEDARRCYLSGRNGIFRSDDGGNLWSSLAYSGGIIPDLWMGRLRRDELSPPSSVPGQLRPFSRSPKPPFREEEEVPGFEERRTALKQRLMELVENHAKTSVGDMDFVGLAALLKEQKGREEGWDRVRALLRKPSGSMFFSLPALFFHLQTKEGQPSDVREEVRKVLTRTQFYRGDTENHWVMYYTVLLLAAQEWPETPPAEWYTGKSTQENYDEAEGWLRQWMRLTVTRGQGEFDSPGYLFMFLNPLFLLHDFAQDGALRSLAGMMIDLLLADYLTESLEGIYGGAYSRVYEHEVLLAVKPVAIYHYLYAGGIPIPDPPHGWSIIAVHSKYRPPSLLATMANRRDVPYVHQEVKRVRNVIRGGSELNPPVFKYTFMTPGYVLGSMQGGILQPIQQHTWGVTWKSAAKNSTFFSVHPYQSGEELAMFFPEDPHWLTTGVAGSKPSYISPDKWVSSSPYEKVVQEGPVLLALYQVPAHTTFPHLNVHVPDCLEWMEEGGWWFGRDGSFFLAVHCSEQGNWEPGEGHRRFRCSGARTGIAVVTGGGTAETFEAFRSRVAGGSAPLLSGTGEDLRFSYEAGAERKLEIHWGGSSRPPQPPKLFRGPFLQAEMGSGRIQFTDGTKTQLLDFSRALFLGSRETRRLERDWSGKGREIAVGEMILNGLFLVVLVALLVILYRRRTRSAR